MNATELQKLKALAQGALNHSDAIGEDEWYSAYENMGIFAPNPDLSFIAAANPVAILELIELAERADKATADVSDLRDQLRQQGNALEAMRERAEKAEAELANGQEIRGYLTPGNEWMVFHSTLEAAQAECDEYNFYWRSQPEFDPEDERTPEAVYYGQQPLQQEGGKEVLSEDELEALMHKHNLIGVAGDNPSLEARLIAFAREVAATQPPDKLQQASAAEPDGRDVHRPLLLARIKRYRNVFGSTLVEAKEACEYGRDMNDDETAFLTPSKEAASTAQVAPAKAWKCSFCGSSSAYGCDDVGCHGHEAGEETASTTDAGQADSFEAGYKNLLFVLKVIAKGHDDPKTFAQLILVHNNLLPEPAQATPEGGQDLPPLPEARHRGPEATGSYFNAYTADQMKSYALEAIHRIAGGNNG